MAVICGSFLMGCGSGTAPDAPRYELVPGPTLVTTLADRTDVVAGALVYDADGHPVPGVAVTFCATAGQLAPGEGLTNAVGAVGVAWSVPVASDTAVLSAGTDGACAVPVAVVLPR